MATFDWGSLRDLGDERPANKAQQRLIKPFRLVA